jgi:hypothetical protein
LDFRFTEFSEVRLQLARGFEKGQNKAYGHSIFIGISSGVGMLARKGKPVVRRGAKPRVSCEKGDGRAAERRGADTNLKSLISASQPKTAERERTLRGVEDTEQALITLGGKPVTIRNYRLPAVLWAGLMLGVMLVLGIGATQGEAAPLLKGFFRGQAYVIRPAKER